MRIAITGSPSTGKTSVAKVLSKRLKCRAINEKEIAVKLGIGKWDVTENELVVPLPKLKKELNRILKTNKNIIIEGHLLCEIKLAVDYLILLTTHPEILELRLETRSYSPEKIMDNVFCEGIDYCKKHAYRKYKKSKIIEIESKKSIAMTVKKILEELGKRKSL